jgi:hypothetical protein
MAIVLAVLYFGLIQLLLIDSSRELAAARRFRSRIRALTLAENAAEGAAWMVARTDLAPKPYVEESDEGQMEGYMTRSGKTFSISGDGASKGLERVTARVQLKGYIDEVGKLHVDVSVHSQ